MPWCTKRASGADELGEVGQERDDVVLGDALDRVDALATSNFAAVPLSQIVLAALFGMMPISAIAVAACASISNQMRKRVSGSHIATISGRL